MNGLQVGVNGTSASTVTQIWEVLGTSMVRLRSCFGMIEQLETKAVLSARSEAIFQNTYTGLYSLITHQLFPICT